MDAGRGSTNITSISIFDANVFKDRFLYQRGHHHSHLPSPTLPHSLITSPSPLTLFLSASLTVPVVTPLSLYSLTIIVLPSSPHTTSHSPLISIFFSLIPIIWSYARKVLRNRSRGTTNTGLYILSRHLTQKMGVLRREGVTVT